MSGPGRGAGSGAPATRPSPPSPREAAAPPPSASSAPPKLLADPPPFRLPPLRAVGAVVVLLVLGTGLAYPAVVYGVEAATGGFAPSGGFVAGGDPNALAQDALGQNITDPSLFWLRPSLTDYNATMSTGESPYGPTDPNLVNLTEYYLAQYGLNNSSAPLDLVGNSESGVDPDLTPAAALVQIPRVSAHTALTEEFLTAFVEEHVIQPFLGFIGPAYVNALALDEELLVIIHQHGGG